ncbi:MAG: pyridoxal phosphate-dependent class II aminotransferase [Fretibacterium sp.]|nr:pyridoxal phosphate-dependent class II aminotransferase [Fretibacterium sp.]
MSTEMTLHGANPEKLYAAMGIPMPADVADFSTNASVLPWTVPPLDLQTLVSHYPDSGCLELRRLIAGREGLSPENVLFVNGSNEALYLLTSCLAGRRAAVLQPAYPEYARALSAYGVETADIFDLEDAVRFDAVFFSNPCNPTGEYIPRQELRALIEGAPDVLFIVDEAYIDFLLTEDCPVPPWGAGQQGLPENLVVLRSLTKFYHLSGARAGYVLAPESRAERLKARQPSWSVNAVAQALALFFLRDEGFARESRDFYRREVPRFTGALRNAGIDPRPSSVHFFLIEAEDDERVLRRLLKQGLVVRHTRNFPGLGGRYLRVATRLPEENDRLAEALRILRGEGFFR